jgi:hypothetical protein
MSYATNFNGYVGIVSVREEASLEKSKGETQPAFANLDAC